MIKEICNFFKNKIDKRVPEILQEKWCWIGYVESSADLQNNRYFLILIWIVPGETWVNIGYFPDRLLRTKKYIKGEYLLKNLKNCCSIKLDQIDFYENKFVLSKNMLLNRWFLSHIYGLSKRVLKEWERTHVPAEWITPVENIKIYI